MPASTISASVLIALGLLAAPGVVHASIVVTIGAPGAEFAKFTGTGGVCSTLPTATCNYGEETFSDWRGGAFTSSFTTGEHSFASGTSISGAYSGSISYDTNNTYGGAYGTAPYPSANGLSQYRLDLSTTGIPGVNYFGVWISAMDASNKLIIYSGGTAVFSFVSSDLRNAIQGTATPSRYYGDPDNGRDSSEPFAYVNIFDTSGYIDRVDFTNNGSSNFENSNNAAGYFTPLTVQGTDVQVTTNTIPAVPEPATFVLAGSALTGLFLLGRRRRDVPESLFRNALQ